MNDVEYKGLKGFILFHLKNNIHLLTQQQWGNLFIAIQDLMIEYEPKRKRKSAVPMYYKPEPFEEFVDIITETNRRLNNGN